MQNITHWIDRQIRTVTTGLGYFLGGATSGLDLLSSKGTRAKSTVVVYVLIYLTVIGMTDLLSPAKLDFEFFYLIGCAFAGWMVGGRAAMLSAVVSGAFSYFDDSRSGFAPHPGWILFWNSTVRWMAFVVVGWLAAEVGRLTRGLERTVQHRTARLQSEVEEHKDTSTRLQETLQLFRQVTENITEVFWVTDPAKTRVSYVSPEFEKVWGQPRKVVYTSPAAWLAAVHPEDRERITTATHAKQVTGEYNEEFRVVRPDKSIRWVQERAFPVRNEQGEVYRIVGITEDITERKQADETLRTQARVLESMAEGVLMSNADGIIQLTNPAADLMLGYERGELIGNSLAILTSRSSKEYASQLRIALEQIKTQGFIAGEYLLRRKDGSQRLVETRSSGLHLGNQFYIVTVGQDITDRVRLERQILEISDREQARIGQDIHDGLCQKLISMAFDVNSLEESLAARGTASSAVSRRISELLDETITESRRVARGLYPVRLETEGLISALDELAQTTCERFGVQCTCKTENDEISCDFTAATHLYRIAQEAVNNAIKHSGARHVSIQFANSDDEMQLSVLDDGSGIAENLSRRTGMGLYIMDYRARTLGGSLRVTRGEGKGTVVCCRVPVKN